MSVSLDGAYFSDRRYSPDDKRFFCIKKVRPVWLRYEAERVFYAEITFKPEIFVFGCSLSEVFMNEKLFTGRKIALTAMFTAVAFGLSYLEFPIFPAASFLKLDFSFSVQLIGAYMLGPALGGIMITVVQLLRLLTTSSGGVGELANLIAAACFVVIPSVIYAFKKGLPTVFLSLAAGTLCLIGASLLSNRFLTFPLYMGEGAAENFAKFFWFIVLFNLIKGVSNSIITLLLYKRLKKLFHKFL